MERKTGSCECKVNRCQVCASASKMETFTSTVTHKSYKIHHGFGCHYISLYLDICFIYLFWHVRPVLTSMLLVPQTVLDILGKIINVLTGNTWEVRLVCKNISLNILNILYLKYIQLQKRKCTIVVIITMALRQLMHFSTWCTFTHCWYQWTI